MCSFICWTILGAVGIICGISIIIGFRNPEISRVKNREIVMQSISIENQKNLGRAQLIPMYWKDMIVNR